MFPKSFFPLLLALLLCPASSFAASGAAKPSAAKGSVVPAFDAEVLKAVNNYRASKGLPSLAASNLVWQQAYTHSCSMAKSKSLSHDGFEARVDKIKLSLSLLLWAENVAFNYPDSPGEVVEMWRNSPGHNKNMLGDFNTAAVASCKAPDGAVFYTLILVKSDCPAAPAR